MHERVSPARVARLDEIDPVPVAGGLFHPIRRALGVRAFGINAYSAGAAGDQLIEPHDETGTGSGGHEEAYVVVSGRATFTVGGEEIDAPAGTIVFVPDVATTRSAVANEAGTIALVIGGPADRPLPVSPFEYWFVAEGRIARATAQACAGDGRAKEWARTDRDLDTIRGDPRYTAAVG